MKIIRWWKDELERLDVGVELGNAAAANGIMSRRPSFVLLATGSVPIADPAMRPGGIPFYGGELR